MDIKVYRQGWLFGFPSTQVMIDGKIHWRMPHVRMGGNNLPKGQHILVAGPGYTCKRVLVDGKNITLIDEGDVGNYDYHPRVKAGERKQS